MDTEKNKQDIRQEARQPLLTSESVHQQKFSLRFRGYDVQEVDAFLVSIEKTIGWLTQENASLKNELLKLK